MSSDETSKALRTDAALRALRRTGFALLILAAGVRVAAVNCQLWLDEIWSIRLAQKAKSALGVFRLHHDNNHWLNTLYVYWLGPGAAPWTYHLLALATGVGTAAVGWLIARRRGPCEGVAALVLLGGSEFLIEFSADARGYAPAGFFAVLCVWLWVHYLERPRAGVAAAFAASAVLGLLSHLTFVVVLAGLIATSTVALARRESASLAIRRLALLFAAPLLALAALYAIDVRAMVRGGGPPTPGGFAAAAAGMVLAVPPPAAVIAGVSVFILFSVQTLRLIHKGESLGPFYAVIGLFVIAALFVAPRLSRVQYLHPRYVYIAAPFVFILAAAELGRWARSGRAGCVVAVAILAAFVAVNAVRIGRFIRLGRGQYVEAMDYILSHTAEEKATVASNVHPTSTLMVLQYDEQAEGRGRRLAFFLDKEWWARRPQWLIAEEDAGETIVAANGLRYVRRASFPNGAAASGLSWTVYENAP